MTKALFADTGPLLAAVDPGDQYHQRAQTELVQLTEAGFGVLVASSTLQEAYSLVLRRLGIPTAHRWLGEIHGQAGIVVPTRDDLDEAIQLIQRYRDQPLTLFDALLAVLARRADIPVWTYDHHFDLLRIDVWR